MARRKLTALEQLKGVEKAIASPRTPPQLKEGLRRRADGLRKRLGKKKTGGAGLLSTLGL